MLSPAFSSTVLPSLGSGGSDIRVEMTIPEELGTAVVEVMHGQTASGGPIGTDPALHDARGRIAAISSLAPQEVFVSARAWQLPF
ncbi:hypothetical protein [Microvirga puerhi]|uniref:Uncharacterized protein n=1 Tax=Microvirga puerhi TaxID=2876078 RepID=A0ABS7VMU0_9HYPH|nr:hypothetical protein [Microvirga puerhi]MBZ6076850.1 hypothetical protein [Microvirga puerhi]